MKYQASESRAKRLAQRRSEGKSDEEFLGLVADVVRLLTLSAVLSVGLSRHAVSEEATADERYNVLFIAVDDMRLNLGCYGDPKAVTPHLDRLAAEGILFRSAYCQFTSCNASRASLLTGMRPDSIRVWSLRTHFRTTTPDSVTLPEHFKNNGYHTESIGKVLHNYNGITDDDHSWSVPSRLCQISHFGDYAKTYKQPGKSGKPAAEMSESGDAEYVDDQITRDALSTIERFSNTTKPFFLAVGFMKPHSPYNAPKKYWDLYDRDQMLPLGPITRPEGITDLNWFHFNEIRGFGDVPRSGPLKDSLAKKLRHGYYAATSYADDNIGRLLKHLREHGLEDNTIVVFWSDHGYHLSENDHWTKVTARELDAGVPLIFRIPGIRPAITESIVEYTDIYPTLSDLCGLPEPDGIDGRSFVATLSDPKAETRQCALTQVARPWSLKGKPESMGYSIRTNRFRYTRWVDVGSRKPISEELYDHKVDQLERHNLISENQQQEALQQLRRLMDQELK